MKFLDLINKCLVELNYKKVANFNELYKNDHLKLKNILNVINNEICAVDDWSFLLRKTQLTLTAGVGEVKNTICGRIKSLFIDGEKYTYTSDFEKFLFENPTGKMFSILNDMILLPAFTEDKIITVIYYTSNCAKSLENEEVSTMTTADDESVIPEPFVEPLLVYGTCLRMKANPEYAKFSYWLSMYNNALANLRANVSSMANEYPQIIIGK